MTEREIFFAALEMATPEARAAYLQGVCHGDVPLRRKVDELLKEHFSNDSLLAEPLLAEEQPTIKHDLPPEEAPAQMLGRYKLLEKIGEGGFGEVWMAEQREPIKRRVALKIIKLGMDSRQIVNRFAAERQALAMMDHPNIAKIFDAGTTDSVESEISNLKSQIRGGRPYFVMELVRGIKITEYCDQNQLPTQERLRLFILVCQAIQHAHQKGIIHRDIKPSNILVTLHDGVAVPKVIDFGIAKATQQELTDQTVFTQFQQFMGTPAYISPEQAEMSGLDIDTRADIYSLGVLLYELLVGQTPFDAREMMEGGLDALRQIIREKEPVRPSTRLNTLAGQARVTAGQRRQTDVGKLVHQLEGDLDWIVMTCLEKDRTRRYDTANGLAADLQRHLANEPVLARPPSNLYRFEKLVRRNKLGFAAAAAVAAALLVGLFVASWQAVRATHAEGTARRAEHAGKIQADQARTDRDRAVRAEADARGQALAARRYAYAAEINVALQALAENNLSRARELLERQQPKAGEEDLRGFEWRYLWQLCRGEEFATFRDEVAHGTAFSPDGRVFAYAGRTIIVRETASRKVVATLTSRATTLSFASHTNLLASGHDTGVKLWNTETWQEVRSLPKAIHPALFSPDGRWLLTGVAEGFRVWDTQTWQPMGLCTGVPRQRWQTRHAVAFSPDSQFLVTIAGEGANADIGDHFRVWPLPGLEKFSPVLLNREANGSTAASPPGPLTFLPGGKFVVAGLWDGQIAIWDFATRKVVATRKEHTGSVTAVAVAPNGETFATASSDRTVNLWDAVTFKHLLRLRGHVNEVWSLAFAPNGHTVMSGSTDGTTKLWRLDARHDQMLEGPNVLLGFIGDGRSVIAASSKSVSVWTPESGARVDFPIPTNLPISSEKLPPFQVKPHEPLGALGRSDGTVELWHLETGVKGIAWPAHKDAISVIAFSSDGKWLATGTLQGEIKIWEFATRREAMRLGPVRRKLLCLAFSPDGKTVAASGESSRVWLWEAATGRQVVQLPGHGTLVASVAFSPDGKTLATASLSNEARVWDVPSGKLRTTLRGHVQGVIAVAFSPDGKSIATGSHDGKVKLWDAATHQELATFPLGGLFPTLGFSPDGRMLAVGNAFEARIHVLSAPSFEEIAAAEAKEKTEMKQP